MKSIKFLKSLFGENKKQLPDNLPVLTPKMIYLVTGQMDADEFYKNGMIGAECIKNILEKNGYDIIEFNDILDFGCGCGRIMRHWRGLNKIKFHGVDYNPFLLNFCKKSFPFGTFSVNKLNKSLEYKNETFDFIYAISVFTHLTENMQYFWINELRRILKQGGLLYMTTHGLDRLENANLNENLRNKFLKGDIVIIHNNLSGTNDCAVFHPDQYVCFKLSYGFKIVDFIPMGAKDANQDVYLLQKIN